MNFSLYVENTNDLFVQKINKTWIKSELVSSCMMGSCSNVFSIFNRKHHCRACGSIFCSTCCYRYIIIPKEHFDIPKPDNNWSFSSLTSKKESLVCNICYKKIEELNNFSYLL